MQNISLEKLKKVHFIGIGGISMSALAEILITKGIFVSGSDAKESELTVRLVSLGAKIIYGQSAENITSDIDLIVYTAAILPIAVIFISKYSLSILKTIRNNMLTKITITLVL